MQNDTVTKTKETYHTAGLWQIGFFALNNGATNLYLAMMGYVSYYINGIVGISVVAVSVILTLLNIFDGITDPVAGILMDKTNGKLGKFRPFMIIGNFLMIVSCICLFFFTHKISSIFRLPFFIVIYALFIIGYTFQTVVTKSGQTVLTNHPRQRPLSTTFDSLFIMAAFGSVALFVSNYLVPKYGSFKNPGLFMEFVVWVTVVGGICTVLAVVGIWNKDRAEYFGDHTGNRKIKLKEYVSILKGNRPIRILVLSASLNKFASSVYSNTTVGVMLFGILMQDYSIAGLIGIITAVPTLFVVASGIKVAQRFGQKKAFIIFTWCGIAFQILMLIQFWFGDLTKIRFSFGQISSMTVVFFILFVLLNGCKSITNNMVVPMIADCSDYEVYRSGNYVPGLMGAVFSFVDKVFAAFGTTFVGVVVTMIGYGDIFPQVEDTPDIKIKIAALFLYCIIPVIGWAFSLLCMKFYSLDKNKMRQIHNDL